MTIINELECGCLLAEDDDKKVTFHYCKMHGKIKRQEV